MSKPAARSKQSYRNEELVLDLVPIVLSNKGFTNIRTVRKNSMKFFDADDAKGCTVRFWLKLGWSGSQKYSAIQFDFFAGEDGKTISDQRFLKTVSECLANVKKVGASYGLFVHLNDEGILSNWVAISIDNIDVAYREQLKIWPNRARNAKSPTLWFKDERNLADASCIETVLKHEVDLSSLALGDSSLVSQLDNDKLNGTAITKVTAEIERRMKQQAFRLAIGNYYGWQCVVSGNTVKEVLDACHLPDRDWRFQNRISDGILLRTDLHRLLDSGLASIKNGYFLIEPSAQMGEYLTLHNKPVLIKPFLE